MLFKVWFWTPLVFEVLRIVEHIAQGDLFFQSADVDYDPGERFTWACTGLFEAHWFFILILHHSLAFASYRVVLPSSISFSSVSIEGYSVFNLSQFVRFVAYVFRQCQLALHLLPQYDLHYLHNHKKQHRGMGNTWQARLSRPVLSTLTGRYSLKFQADWETHKEGMKVEWNLPLLSYRFVLLPNIPLKRKVLFRCGEL